MKGTFVRTNLFFKEARMRWSADAGPFWNKVIWIGGILSATGATWQLIPQLEKVGGYMAVAGAIMLFVAKFGAKNPPSQAQVTQA